MKPDDLLTMGFVRKYPIDAARLLESMSAQEAGSLLFPLSPGLVAHVLQYVLPITSAAILRVLPENTIIESVTQMSTTSAIGIIQQSDPESQAWILGKLDPKVNASILKAFSFPDRSAGRLADPKILLFTADRTISDAIHWVRGQPRYDTDDLFILDRQYRLLGKVPLRTLLVTDLDYPIDEIMLTHLETLPAETPFDEMLHHEFWQRAHTLPVLDSSHAFLGVIRYQSLLALARTKESTGHTTQLQSDTASSLPEQQDNENYQLRSERQGIPIDLNNPCS